MVITLSRTPVVVLLIYPEELHIVEHVLTGRYPGWCHLINPQGWPRTIFCDHIALLVAVTPPGGQWTAEDDKFFEQDGFILSWQRLEGEAI